MNIASLGLVSISTMSTIIFVKSSFVAVVSMKAATVLLWIRA